MVTLGPKLEEASRLYVATTEKYRENPWNAEMPGKMAPASAIRFTDTGFPTLMCIEPALRIGVQLILIHSNCFTLGHTSHGILLVMSCLEVSYRMPPKEPVRAARVSGDPPRCSTRREIAGSN